MRELALFAGAGGGILGSHLLGWKTVCAVEIENYPRLVLLRRQQNGILDQFPIWDNITTFDGTPWKGRCDIVTGGFPCQDISAAGKGAGIDGERSGLWGEMFRVVREVGPGFVFVENSPMLTLRGLYRVLGDLASVGYNARWCVLGADAVGAPHKRERIWILAYRDGEGLEERKSLHCDNGEEFKATIGSSCEWWEKDPAEIPDTNGSNGKTRSPNKVGAEKSKRETEAFTCGGGHEARPVVGRVAYGVAHRVDRLKAIGNGQVPAVAAIAFIILSEGLI